MHVILWHGIPETSANFIYTMLKHFYTNTKLTFSLNMFKGLLETITSTANSKDCPGVCMHALASLICSQVLEDVACPSPSMRCCVDSPPENNTSLAPSPGKIFDDVCNSRRFQKVSKHFKAMTVSKVTREPRQQSDRRRRLRLL
jgi:hypothetical protein